MCQKRQRIESKRSEYYAEKACTFVLRQFSSKKAG
jgi:hypothetical protein